MIALLRFHVPVVLLMMGLLACSAEATDADADAVGTVTPPRSGSPSDPLGEDAGTGSPTTPEEDAGDADAQAGDGGGPATPSGPAMTPGSIGAGGSHTCALTATGGVKCWGSGLLAQLGNGYNQDSRIPVAVTGLASGVKVLAAAYYHTCALTTAGGVKCWGNNNRGQLGTGNMTGSNTPADVIGLTSGVAAIATGYEQSCAVTTAGGVKCWGGEKAAYAMPVDIGGLSNIASVAIGSAHYCALGKTGGVKCWGNNGFGQLGNNTLVNSTTPVDVVGLATGVVSITAGRYHTCARTSSGGVKCWGRNVAGNLGDGTNVDKLVPTDVNGLSSGVVAISSGSETSHTCAVLASGSLKCWGTSGSGELGANSTSATFVPVAAVGLAGPVSDVATGTGFTCARVAATKQVQCWGRNGTVGVLGNDSTVASLAPVNVLGLP